MPDFSAERFRTIVAEMEVPSMKAFEDMMSGAAHGADDMKRLGEIMKGYHDLVELGRREIHEREG